MELCARIWRLLRRISLFVAICAGAFHADAQTALLPPVSSIQFSHYQSVRDRTVPGYQASGLPVGAFTFYPSVDVSANYTDNVYAAETHKASDAFLRVSPAAQLQSNWSDRSLNVSATGTFDRYASHSSENVDAFHVAASGSQELGGQAELRAIARFETDRESRDSQNAFTLTDRPIRYRDGSAAIGLSKRFSNILLDGEAGIEKLDYDDATLLSGARLDQDYRDGTIKQFRGRAEILQSPAIGYFGQVSYSRSSYRQLSFLGFSRGSDTTEALAGVRFELPILARGEIGAGYVSSSYNDGRFQRFRGLAIDTSLTFFPTQLTTVLLEGRRSVNDAGTPNASTYVTTSGKLHVDHELLRTLIISAEVSLERDRFNGLDRRDRRVGVATAGDWRISRTLSLRASFDRLDLRSTGLARYRSFTRDRVMLGIGARI